MLGVTCVTENNNIYNKYIWMSGAIFGGSAQDQIVSIRWHGNTVSWYNQDVAWRQLNESGSEYIYTAIGIP